MPSNKSNVQASASEERIVDDLCGDARGKDPSVARLLAGFNQLRSTLGEVGSEADRRLALVSANLDSAVMRFSPEIATRIAEGVTMFHTAFSRTQGQLHLGEPWDSHAHVRDLQSAGRQIVEAIADTWALNDMARADVKLWFLDRLGMRICEAADLGEGFVDNLVNTIIGAGIDYVLEHAPDPKGAFLEMFPADIGTNYNEDDAHLDSVAGAKALTAIESIRVITKASGNMLPRTGSLTIAYQQLLERFVSSGVASLVPPASVEEAHARTYGNLSRASELRRMVLSRPIDGMPDIECTQFVQSMIPAIGGVSIKEAVLRQGTENPTDFTLDIRLLHESGKHILSAVSGKGLSFDQAAARAKRLGFSEGFRFDKKTWTVLRTWDPRVQIPVSLAHPDKLPEDISALNAAKSIASDLIVLEILARATAKTERTRSGNTGKTVVPPNMGAGKRGTIRVGKDDPVTYTPPAPAPSREAGSDTETDEDNSFASGRRNFGRRATLVFLPQKARPSEEAYERARIHGVELYAYISRKPGKGQGPRDLFIPPDGQHFLVSHLPYDAMLEHTNSLVNMYGGPSDVEIRVSTYRQATPASNPVEAS